MKQELLICNRDILLKRYFENISIIKNYSENTILLYYDTADIFMHFLYSSGIETFNEVSNQTLYSFFISISKNKLSNRSKNIKISALNNFIIFICNRFNFCELSKLKHSRFLKKLPIIHDEDELLKILLKNKPAISENWIDYRNYALAILLYSTGIRISEAMNVQMIDFNDGWLRVEKTKNMETRLVPYNKLVMTTISDYMNFCPFSNVNIFWFCRKGKKLTARAASTAIKRMFGHSPHFFRHAFATHLYRNGCDLLVIKEFLGHSSISTTNVYIHIKPKHLLATVNRCHPMAKNS